MVAQQFFITLLIGKAMYLKLLLACIIVHVNINRIAETLP